MKLDPEPQDGPAEYKQHLLLRPRRTYQSMSTSSQFQAPPESKAAKLLSNTWIPPSPSNQTRQARLEHLTTQLLWRLQQTCPYHAASTAGKLVVPQLPLEKLDSNGVPELADLVPGLQDSRGALYEIGVDDDGTLVGLTKEELEESLRTLGVMAASLGCKTEVLRKVMVGDCQWSEESGAVDPPGQDATGGSIHREELWVAEALVTPELRRPDAQGAQHSSCDSSVKQGAMTQNQLRLTVTGPTTSGKSTLLGTLSTGLLDNGNGRSRLSQLKHRHELKSGVTSSVAQELIGYRQNRIYNYSHGGIESWLDIHDFTKDGRLVFVLDSAGHPRYRRTILRGIVGWAPHWTILCIAGNDSDQPADSGLASDPSEPTADLAQAHIDLCLKLDLPLAIVVTKMDLASKASIQRIVGGIILSSVKAAGRIPRIVNSDQDNNEHLTEVPTKDVASVSKVVDEIQGAESLQKIVPVVLSSAVTGKGLGVIHALLESLPLPPSPTSHDYTGPALNPEQPACLFHITDLFSLPASFASVRRSDDDEDLGTVVAGYLRFGSLSIGDRALVGPFPSEEDDLRGSTPEERPSPGNYGLSVSHPSSTELGRIAMRSAVPASTIKGEWYHATIVSIRNLRLPVQTLDAGQVGSIGIVLDPLKEELADSIFEVRPPSTPKLRKGMVLAIPSKHMVETGLSLQAASGLTASFPNTDRKAFTVGAPVTIYVASVRAAARVVRMSPRRIPRASGTHEIEDVFTLIDSLEGVNDGEQEPVQAEVEVQFELLTNREWVELGSRVVILAGAGLDCQVGSVVEIVE
jgi:GTPase